MYEVRCSRRDNCIWISFCTCNLRDTFTGADALGDTRHIALFVQDRWQVQDRITLLPGLRLDLFRGSTSDTDRVLRTNPVSPRLGVAGDLLGNHHTVLRTHYGRYTVPVFAQPVLLTDFARPGGTITEALNAAGEWAEISRRSFAGLRRIDPYVKHSYVDQVIVGIEKRQLLRVSPHRADTVHSPGIWELHGVRSRNPDLDSSRTPRSRTRRPGRDAR